MQIYRCFNFIDKFWESDLTLPIKRYCYWVAKGINRYVSPLHIPRHYPSLGIRNRQDGKNRGKAERKMDRSQWTVIYTDDHRCNWTMLSRERLPKTVNTFSVDTSRLVNYKTQASHAFFIRQFCFKINKCNSFSRLTCIFVRLVFSQ